MLQVNLISNFNDFKLRVNQLISESKEERETIVFGVYNLETGEVRETSIELEIKEQKGYLFGFELGIGFLDNYQLLGLPQTEKETET